MSSVTPFNSDIVKKLLAVGIIPQNCTSFTLTSTVGEAVRMQFSVLATPEQYEVVLAALLEHPEEARMLAREFVIFNREDTDCPPVIVRDAPVAYVGES